MQRFFGFAIVAALTSLTASSYLRADDVVTQRGFIVFAPGSSTGTYYDTERSNPQIETIRQLTIRRREAQRAVAPAAAG